eukprot:CAMPEP_0198286740 /NCGR_PEP_ID=MMETSP1449-20131203/5720_1 /TAXON_ID=420275 /ORGANISM="Attheya septentrionalis, Strain CCMP2084" /LENGTH=302 /DNA_ID=CAMNT_0043984525 /DNA_START=108 /DNA_END=1016 /DNA_ORIENTATION=-
MARPFVRRNEKKQSWWNLNFIMGLIMGSAFMWMQQLFFVSKSSYSQLDNAGANLPQVHTVISKTASVEDGWQSIDVYYGDKEGSEYVSDKPWLAQVHQDEAVIALLGENGYFIDLAANEAVELSNTYTLEQRGWDGLCIEPNPVYWYGLSHRKCKVVGALVGAQKEQVKVKFRGVFGGIVGKMDEKLANFKKEPGAKEEMRYTAPLMGVLKKYNVPHVIDYLSLDVEGAEFMIMKDFPFDQYTISVMTVERPTDDLKKLFADNGYVFLKDLAWWGETLWAHKSMGFTSDDPKVKAIPWDAQN